MAIITDDRRYTWQGNVGCNTDSSGKDISETLSVGASVSTVEDAIQAADPDTVVVMPAGAYNWASRIDIQGAADGVVLRGSVDANGVPTTIITFSAFSSGGFLLRATSVGEDPLNVDASLTEDAVKGGATITLASVPSWVVAGKYIGIDQLDEASFVLGDDGDPLNQEPGEGASYREDMGNGTRGLGMINKVVSKTGTTITFEMPLNYGYKVSQTAQIFQPSHNPETATPLTGFGLENLKIVCGFVEGGTKVIYGQGCQECYVKNVEIEDAPDIPIWFEFSYRCQIEHCYLHGTENLGSGGGYAPALYHLCTGFLIEDNIFQGFHNCMTVNYGCTCNVFAYNYELDGVSGSGQNPGMNTHGVHCYLNLWEGNYCEDKMLADWTHGSSSHNTLHRCRITGENGTDDSRCCVSVEYYNRYWNIVGNVLGVSGLQNKYLQHSGSTSEGSEGTIIKVGGVVNIGNNFSISDANSYTSGLFILIHGNWDYVQSTITYDGNIADHDLLDSYYLGSKPTFFASLDWPPYGPADPGGGGIESIPAGYRYANGEDPPPGGEGGGAGSSVVGKVAISGKVTIA